NVITVPTQAFVNGDFSGLISGTSVIPIFDPTTTSSAGTRTQFPGNIIPLARFTQLAKVVGQYMPTPTLPGIISNFNSNSSATWPYLNTYVPLIKIDHSISNKQKIMGSYT